MRDEDFRTLLRELISEANKGFDDCLSKYPDAFDESDRNRFVLGWIEGHANRREVTP